MGRRGYFEEKPTRLEKPRIIWRDVLKNAAIGAFFGGILGTLPPFGVIDLQPYMEFLHRHGPNVPEAVAGFITGAAIVGSAGGVGTVFFGSRGLPPVQEQTDTSKPNQRRDTSRYVEDLEHKHNPFTRNTDRTD